MHTLLAQFLALRHEVHLQTRAARTQQEQNALALEQLSGALDALRQSQARAREAGEQERDEAVRPLLKTLVDVYDALALAGREVKRVRDALPPDATSPDAAPARLDVPEPPAASFWGRLFGLDRTARWQQETVASLTRALSEGRSPRTDAASEPPSERVGQVLASVVAGYTMSLQRVERALQQHGLEPIEAVGRPFDPEFMEVVEAVSDSGCPSGEVLGEVRRGYLWRGRVFRYAQVRVAKS